MTERIFLLSFTRRITLSLHSYLIVITAALLVRGISLWWWFPVSGWEALGFGFELGRVAANISEGHGLSSPFGPGTKPTAWFMPAVPLIWACIFKLFGLFSRTSLGIIYIVDTVFHAAAACCYLYLMRALLRNGSLRSLPLVTVLIIIIFPEHFVALTRPWYWGLQKLGVALMMICALAWHRSPSIRNAIMLGLFSGLTLLVNSVPAILLAALLLQHILRDPKRFPAVLSSALVLSVVALCLTPWVIRNYWAFDAFIPLRQNTWIEIRQGNNEHGSIVQGVDSTHPNVKFNERNAYVQQGEVAYEESARRKTLSYVQQHPMNTAKRIIVRTFMFWLSDLLHEGLYGGKDWQLKSIGEQTRDITVFLCVTAPLAILLCTFLGGWLREVEASWILITPLIVFPLPYYLSHIHPTYFSSVKPILLLVVSIGIGEALRLRGRKVPFFGSYVETPLALQKA